MQALRGSTLAMAVASALLVVACGDVGEPDLGVIPSTTTSTTAGPAAAADVEQTRSGEQVPFVAQLTPTRPSDFEPQVLLATDAGVRLADGTLLLADVAADRALDDPTGGIVVEISAGDQRQIVWYPAGGEGGQVVTEGDDRLMDVGFVGGGVLAVVADNEQVRLLRLGDPDERTLLALEPGTSVVSASAAAGLYAVVLHDEECGSLQFLGPDGAPLDIGKVEPPMCQTPGRGTFGLVAFSPDGETFAYTERTFRSDNSIANTDLVVRDLAGTELYRGTVATDGQRITSLSLDRNLVVLLRQTADGSEIVRFDVRRPGEVTVTSVEGTRSASFTRVPLDATGTPAG